MAKLFGSQLGASLLPCLGKMLKVWKLPWASRAKVGQEYYMRETDSKDEEVYGVQSPLGLPPPQLSPSRHLGDQVAWLSHQNPVVCPQQQSKICTGKGNPVLPPLPSLGRRSRGLCFRLGVCTPAAHPRPSPTSIPAPPPARRPQPSPSLVSPLPPGIPHVQPLSGALNPLQGSCSKAP